MLEKIQKVALKIILGEDYHSYEKARQKFNLKLLSERRLDLSTRFALKLYNSKYSSHFYNKSHCDVETRSRTPLIEPLCNTKKCYQAPHNYLTRLVNQNAC